MTTPQKRHGWLIIIVISSIGGWVFLSVYLADFGEALSASSQSLVPVLFVVVSLNVVYAMAEPFQGKIALFNWKKWGFWGLLINYIIGFILDLGAGENLGEAVSGMVDLAILYGVLQLGEPKSGWSQLE